MGCTFVEVGYGISQPKHFGINKKNDFNSPNSWKCYDLSLNYRK